MSEENTVEAVQKVLGTPISPEYPETALKVRRNLLIASLLAFVAVAGGVSIDPAYPILGFKFIGLKAETIQIGLLFVVLYLLLHFAWYAIDEFVGWRVRVTGTRVAFVTTAVMAAEHADYPNDARQSTLYRWWYEKARYIGNVTERTEAASAGIQTLEAQLKALAAGPDMKNVNNAIRSSSDATREILHLKRSVENLQKVFESNRIPVSLERFDKWFEFLLRSQNLRWLLIDTLTPLIAGVTAICVLTLN